MTSRRLLILLLLAGLAAAPAAPAGIIFGRKKEKADPKARVPELITTLQGDPDADKRARAAEELRTYDAAAHPEVIPALISALRSDARPNVRAEAAGSLGKVRPVSPSAGEALEQALATDSSMRVRLQARSALLQYHWAGYRSGKKGDVPPLGPSQDPPGGPEQVPPVIRTTPVPAGAKPAPARSALTPPPGPSTGEPPLAPEPPPPLPAPLPTRPDAPSTPPPPGGPDLP